MLLQRGNILFKNIEEYKKAGENSKIIDLDYMGDARFEWGAIPLSRANIEYFKEEYKFYPIDIFNKNNEQMFIYANSTWIEKDKQNNLNNIVEFCSNMSYLFWREMQPDEEPSFNFWWDIDNNLFIFYGKERQALINKFIDDCYEKDGQKEGIKEKLLKLGYRINK